MPGAPRLLIQLTAAAIPSSERIRALAAATPPRVLAVLVADQISSTIRDALNDAGIGWLDRRGHLRLVADGIHVDADIPVQSRNPGDTSIDRGPITGRSGLAAASALLLRPEDPMGVSEIARVAQLNPSSITRAMTSLVDAHLTERRGHGVYRARVPELFWALADVWPRRAVTVRWASSVEPDGPHPFADPGTPDWAVGGARGALAWGAPVVLTDDSPMQLYVPDEPTVRRIAARHRDGTGSAVTLSADPNGFVTKEGSDMGSWSVAAPLFCALDLTHSSPGREALEQWTPPERFTRVWWADAGTEGGIPEYERDHWGAR